MKNSNFFCFTALLLAFVSSNLLQGQTTTITLKPNAVKGKDALVSSFMPSNNYGNHPDFVGIAWTNGGNISNARALIDFDLSSIPRNAVINSANLSLYGYNSTANVGHSTQSGSNECVLQRIIQDWKEDSVTWNNQPSSTTQNEVTLTASTSVNQHYLNINVRNLVQDMIADTTGIHGFLLKLKTEQAFRSLLFASSDNTDSTLHPELTISYQICQSTITLKPNAVQGKDALVSSFMPSNNYGNHPDFVGIAWTNGGNISNARALIDFDLSSIPQNAVINSANLSLYGYNSTANVGHSTQSGSNECVLQRIIQDWKEDSVTWNNQPSSTTQNEVTLPASTSVNQHYLNINVRNLVQDMVTDTTGIHGFLLKLKTEQAFRSLLFASSDNTDSTLHPELTICYSILTGLADVIEKNANEFNLYPNPTESDFTISTQLNSLKKIEIFNNQGKIVKEFSAHSNKINVSLEHFPKGIYYIRLSSKNTYETKKVFKL